MFFVETRYHRNPVKVPQQIRYISHREERLQGGERRELFGIGDRYKAFRCDEKAIERAFAEDSRGLRRPAYFRFILTVDNPAAERFARLDGTATERAIRDAVQKTFRSRRARRLRDPPARRPRPASAPTRPRAAESATAERSADPLLAASDREGQTALGDGDLAQPGAPGAPPPPTRTPAPANAPDSAAATRVQGKTGGIALRAAPYSASAARTPDRRVSPDAGVTSGGEVGGAKRGCRSRTAGSRDGDQPRSRASRATNRAATAIQGAAGSNAKRALARPRGR
jgi:hypothetical protein